MKIVIVGGGTAGWISALILAEANSKVKKFDITVIDSSKIPIIGAGEGSTGVMTDLIDKRLKKLGVSEIDFLNNTEATLKLGIRFKDWMGTDTEYLSPIEPSPTYLNFVDYAYYYALLQKKMHLASAGGYAMENEYSTYQTNKRVTNGAHSYHFDAHKVGEYFKSVCLKNGVHHIDAELGELYRNESGNLDSVSLKDVELKVEADLWIDCTGFARKLINPMGGGWQSYSKWLPTNNAIPYIHSFQDNEDVKLETLAWAMPNGWMWQIPTQTRYGCGYVYSDMFTTYDNAVDELIKTTNRKIEPLRNIKFEAGRVNEFWVHNVIAVGLASSFLEPLQATSIHSTITQMNLLRAQFLRTSKSDTITDVNRKKYNEHIGTMVDDFKDLIQMQYMTNREDTPFWKYCKYELPKTDFVKYVLDASKHRTIGSLDFKEYSGAANWGVWSWTLGGLGLFNDEVAIDGLNMFDAYELSKEIYNNNIKLGNRNKLTYLKSKDFMKALIDKKIK
jgi:tryptophan halogenase